MLACNAICIIYKCARKKKKGREGERQRERVLFVACAVENVYTTVLKTYCNIKKRKIIKLWSIISKCFPHLIFHIPKTWHLGCGDFILHCALKLKIFSTGMFHSCKSQLSRWHQNMFESLTPVSLCCNLEMLMPFCFIYCSNLQAGILSDYLHVDRCGMQIAESLRTHQTLVGPSVR